MCIVENAKNSTYLDSSFASVGKDYEKSERGFA
jgi:hypothetical protein